MDNDVSLLGTLKDNIKQKDILLSELINENVALLVFIRGVGSRTDVPEDVVQGATLLLETVGATYGMK